MSRVDRRRSADQHDRQGLGSGCVLRLGNSAFTKTCNDSSVLSEPGALWDERLSTAAVERELIAADVSRARRAKVIDEHAAVFILQGALDRLARGTVSH
jgi:Holliday junction resolvase